MADCNSLKERAVRALCRTLRPRWPNPRAVPLGPADVALVEWLETTLASLPELTREVFIMHRFEDLDYIRIAHRLGISVGEVERHIAQALYRLCIEFNRRTVCGHVCDHGR